MESNEIRVGSIYEYCAFHPVLCTGVDEVGAVLIRAHLDEYAALRVGGMAVEEAISQLPTNA